MTGSTCSGITASPTKKGRRTTRIDRAGQAALKEFRKEVLIRKQQVKDKKLPARRFIS